MIVWQWFHRFRVPLLAGLAIVALWFAAGASRGLLAVLSHANPALIAAMLLTTASWLAVRFVRWQYMMRRAGLRVPVRGSLAAYLAALPGTATPAYVGELIRSVFIRRRFGVPVRQTIWVIAAERLMDVVALALLFSLASTGWWRAAGIATFAIVLVIATYAAPGAGAREEVSFVHVAVTLILSVTLWAIAGLLVALGATAIGDSISAIDSVRIFSSGALGGALSLMPAGIGATGSVMILQIGRLGLPLGDAVAIVSLVRLASTGAVLAVGSLFLWKEMRRGGQAHAPAASAHFDSIADEYLAQFPAHVWQHLLARKLELIANVVATDDVGRPKLLDIGCGLGIQSAELARSGRTVIGIDVSEGLLRHAAAKGVPVAASSVRSLPFPSNSFDAAYAIGILHHLESRAAQVEAFREVMRILKPGGLFLIHESNPRNPLFRFYFGYAFPMLKSIDEGTEWWIDPRSLARISGFAHERTTYFTFLPDFVPRAMMRPLLAVQRFLERSPLREWSVHYFAVLRKTPSSDSSNSDLAAPIVAQVPASTP